MSPIRPHPAALSLQKSTKQTSRFTKVVAEVLLLTCLNFSYEVIACVWGSWGGPNFIVTGHVGCTATGKAVSKCLGTEPTPASHTLRSPILVDTVGVSLCFPLKQKLLLCRCSCWGRPYGVSLFPSKGHRIVWFPVPFLPEQQPRI